MGDRDVTERAPTDVLSAPEPPTGRLAVLTAYAMGAAAIPVPFIPDRLLSRVRGAVVHDVTSRHGLSLTSEARAALADVTIPTRARDIVKKAALFASRRVLKRAGPLAAIGAVTGAVEVYALGHLLERYVRDQRPAGAVRITVEEAKRVRELIDDAVTRALSPALQPVRVGMDAGVEDLRDDFTRWVDSLLLWGATLPSYLERRLDRAFDEVASSSR